MKRQRIAISLLTLAAAFSMAPSLRADTLDVTLTQATVTVAQGTSSVAFYATIFNPSSTDTVYLNAASPITFSSLISVDSTPFLLNAPVSLAPLATSSSFEIFDVDLSPSITSGFYSGVFSILGGPDGGTYTDFSDLADVDFTVDVTSTTSTGPTPTPEPATLLLLGSGLSALGFFRRTFARP